MLLACFTLVIVLSLVSAQSASNLTDCVDGPSVWYNGTRNYTKSGITCQRWDVTSPHRPLYRPKDGGHHNFCRNPDHDVNGTWCYTTNFTKKWEYCAIPKCPDDSKLIWTNLNRVSKTTQLFSLPADAEIVQERSSSSGNINVSIAIASNGNLSEFWAVTSDYRSGQIFFADYKSQYLGVYNETSNTIKYYLEGMGHGIESMAYDWMTGNLYLSDSTLKWILVASSDFKHYNYVYKTDPDSPYGLTLHAKRRYLYFSTYKSLGSKIYRTDMAGENATILFQYPHVYDVTGMTVDYADDKLYWVDFTGYGSTVTSSNLDGTNKTQMYYTRSSIFWGIASYLNHLFVTDVHARNSLRNQVNYYLWWIPKTKNQRGRLQVGHYKLQGKPRGITVMSKNVEYSPDKVSQLGSCQSAATCDQICLPRINATRECMCTIGYTKQGDTRCVIKQIKDNFMLVSDAGQGKVFQLPLAKNVTSYVLQTLPFDTKTSFFVADLKSNFYFWSDENQRQIFKATSTGSTGRAILTNTHARSLAMEPNDGNLYFIDDDSQYISVIETVSKNVRTIMKPNAVVANTTDLKQLTLDLEQKYVYWTDTNTFRGKGQVWRMKYDGSQKELVFDKLDWPHAITYDPANKTLFFSEAKQSRIYAVPITSLTTVNGSLSSTAIKYEFSQNRRTSNIAEIQVYKNTLYFYDRMTRSLEQVDTSVGVSSHQYFGPREFYRVRSLVVWSKQLYVRHIAPQQSNCLTKPCAHICVSMSETKNDTKCVCKNGFKLIGSTNCITDGTQKFNQPPSYGSSCPSSINRILEPCDNSSVVTWVAPTWTDDQTSESNLSITLSSISSPATLRPGIYEISYTATDSDGAIGHCRFTITIILTTCRPRPVDRSRFVHSSPTCTPDGKVYNITCRKPNQVVHPYTRSSSFVTNQCFSSGEWMFPSLQDLTCVDRPLPEQTVTPGSIPGNATKSTFTTNSSGSQPVKANSSSSTAGHTLNKGLIAGIVILIVVFVAVVAIIVAFQVRKVRAGGSFFPVVWQPRDDNVNLHADTDDGTNHYSVL